MVWCNFKSIFVCYSKKDGVCEFRMCVGAGHSILFVTEQCRIFASDNFYVQPLFLVCISKAMLTFLLEFIPCRDYCSLDHLELVRCSAN